jgi:alanine dehydrogenase
MFVLTDEDVELLESAAAIEAMRGAFVAQAEGRLFAPPRLSSGEYEGSIILSAGALAGEKFGFRAYSHGNIHADQIVALYDRKTWMLDAIVLGHLLGERRTGAIGALAVDTLASAGATTVGMIGTGNQAYNQLWALRGARTIDEVRVYSRNQDARERFAARCRAELGMHVVAVDSAEAAVRDAGIVLLCTTSKVPVIEAEWVSPGAHVTTMGAKTDKAHECPIDLVERATLVTTDSLDQLADYGSAPISEAAHRPAVALAPFVSGEQVLDRKPDDITLFISVGVTGTESLLVQTLLDLLPPERLKRNEVIR